MISQAADWTTHPLVVAGFSVGFAAALGWIGAALSRILARLADLDHRLTSHMATEEAEGRQRNEDLHRLEARMVKVEDQVVAVHRRLDQVIGSSNAGW